MTLTFRLIVSAETLGLYIAVGTPLPERPNLYFLCIDDQPSSSLPEQIDFADSWERDGGYIFALDLTLCGSDLLGFLQRLGFGAPERNTRFLAWVINPDMDSFAASVIPAVKGQQLSATVSGSGAIIAFANVDLNLPQGTLLTPNFDRQQFEFSGQSSTIILERTNQASGGLSPALNFVSVPADITDPQCAALIYNATNWDSQAFYTLFRDNFFAPPPAWGGEVRYFYPIGQDFAQLVYPLFVPFDLNDPNSEILYSFNVQMQPFGCSDGTRTAFIFAPGQVPPSLASNLARLVSGIPAQLTPLDGVGFFLGTRPRLTSEAGPDQFVYLAPLGSYCISLPSGAGAVMCGLSGLEYLQLHDGDVLHLVPSQPAFAPNFLSSTAQRAARLIQGDDDAQLLTADYTTSWLQIQPSAAPAQASTPLRGYFAQPNTAVNYAGGALAQPTTYPTPVSSLVMNLDAAALAAGDSSPVFPMTLYGGIYPPAGSNVPWVNDGVSSTTFADFEKRILTTARHGSLRGTQPSGPVFQQAGGAPLAGRSATPQGFLVQLNAASPRAGSATDPPPGTWQTLLLAQKGNQVLSINADPATGRVDDNLAYALMNNQVFLVLNNWDTFKNLHNRISIGPYNFQISPPTDVENPRDTILVFKYQSTLSLTDLIHATEQWADTTHMISPDQHIVAAAQATLLNMLAIAEQTKGEPNDPFVYFRDEVATQPAWTGLLAVNAYVSGGSSDIQALFAGIDGPLQAHHLGVALNQIKQVSSLNAADQPQPTIDQSALFGAIYYEDLSDPPAEAVYYFMVRRLITTFLNSAVTDFSATVGMKIDQLFGRPVTLDKAAKLLTSDLCAPANMLCISGKYQQTDAVGTVNFAVDADTPQTFIFDRSGGFIRVLDRFNVTGATLAPLDAQSQTPTRPSAGDPQTVRSRFSISGELLFNQQPFPNILDLDLFSYGVEEDDVPHGLPLENLAFDISVELSAENRYSQAATISPNFANIIVTDRPKSIRPGALLAKLPLKLTGFQQDDKGLSASALKAVAVHTPQLLIVDPQGKTSLNYTTTSPQYALRFDLPLGSLGSLSEVLVGISAGLVLAWGASEGTLDNDGAAIFVQLPQLSAGVLGFELQGLIQTTFGDANLILADYNPPGVTTPIPVYAMLFNNIALSIFGFQVPPGVIVDFVLFADPTNPTGSNIAWNLAATQLSRADALLDQPPQATNPFAVVPAPQRTAE